MRPIASIQTTWKHWKQLYPQTTMVRISREPYQPIAYPDSIVNAIRSQPLTTSPDQWPAQTKQHTLVLGLKVGTESKAYPLVRLSARESPFEEEVGGLRLMIHFDNEANAAWVTDKDEQLVPCVIALLKPWMEFHPDTTFLE